MKLIKRYFEPSAIKARIIGDISLFLALIATYMDVIIPIVQEYPFGTWIDSHKGLVIIALITIKFLTNLSKKDGSKK